MPAQATRSPTEKPLTSGPTASITPALSSPMPEGSDFTACTPRRISTSR